MASKRRPHIPLSLKLEVALRQLGLDPATAELDHSPALALREFDEATGLYTPDANDPAHMAWRSKAAHFEKTTGTPAGQKVVTTANGDIAKIAKARRLNAKTEAFRRKVLTKVQDTPPEAADKNTFLKRRLGRKLQSANNLRRKT